MLQREMTVVALKLLRTFAEALDLPPDSFDSLYGSKPNEHIKPIRYPGQKSTASSQGVGAHKDSGSLSFLFQDRQKGLQVEVTPDNRFDAVPLPGSFVVNIGELLELATNGYGSCSNWPASKRWACGKSRHSGEPAITDLRSGHLHAGRLRSMMLIY